MASLSKVSSNARSVYPAAVPQFSYHPSRRSVVHSTKGIVTSTQPLATQCGLRILQAGGNCADAAVATAAGLNVTEPSSTGIGGDMFCLFYDAKTKKVNALNGSGRSGAANSLEQVRADLKIPVGEPGSIPARSVHAATVPGAAAGWVDTVARFGSGRLSLHQILTPAIELAERGFPVSDISATFWADYEEHIIAASPDAFNEILKKDVAAASGYRAPQAGEIIKTPTLANTFRLLAEKGKEGFYQGPTADSIVQAIKERGGNLTHDDLIDHMRRGSEAVEPISLTFSGQGLGEDGRVELWEHPPNGQGIIALMALGMLEQLEKKGKIRHWTQGEHNSADHLHAVIEVLRIAFSDRNWWIADPNEVDVPTEGLIATEYLAKRAELFDPEHASDVVEHGSPAFRSSDTVYLAVSDSEGNAISFINSLCGGFGTCIIPKGCGFALQNRGVNFSLDPGHPNVLAPRKRPYHTIIPALLTNPSDATLNTVFGVMGGFMQPQGHLQVLLNMLVFGMNPQAALDAPRICIGAGVPDASKPMDNTIYLEEGIEGDVADELERRGHRIKFLSGYERGQFGRGQVIRKHEEDGQIVYSAGSDQRGDGAACPYF